MSAEKKEARFRFYGSLNDVLSVQGRGTGPVVRYAFWGQPAVKDAIEAQGIPHPEVDLVLANDAPVAFDYALSSGDRISVYPWIQSLPRPDAHLRPEPLHPPRFVCDVHLGRLAHYLRMLGFDTRYESDRSDSALARISDAEDRVLLTRDVELLKRSRVRRGRFIRAQAPRRRLVEIIRCFDLAADIDPLSRCLNCNATLHPAAPEAVDEQVPPHAREAHDDFVQCPACESVYWAGTHVERMEHLIDDVLPDDTDALSL